MIKYLILSLGFVISILTSSLSFADNLSYDHCEQLPGQWHAAIHIKDHGLCDQYNGCEHFDLVTFKRTEQDNYLATLYFSNDGTNITVQHLPFSCHANQFRFEHQEGKTLKLVCDESNHCYMIVDTMLFTAELIKR